MPQDAPPRARPDGTPAFEQLPSEVLSRVYSLASTPSCPAPVLLAHVSKSWGAAAGHYLEQEGVSIELQLAPNAASTEEQLRQEAERLWSLGMWIFSRGDVLSALVFRPNRSLFSHTTAGSEQAQARSWHMSEIVSSLKATCWKMGSLRLQQLQLPAIGMADPDAMCCVLSSCHQLRHLSLDAGEPLMLNKGYPKALSMALRHLTQLTSLSLDSGLFQQPREYCAIAGLFVYGSHDKDYDGNDCTSDEEEQSGDEEGSEDEPTSIDLDPFWRCLPSSLAAMDLMKNACSDEESRMCLSTSSLQHLTALRQLALPDNLLMTSSSSGGSSSGGSSGGSNSNNNNNNSSSSSSEANPLAALTALTRLSYGAALQQEGHELLELPNLVELQAGHASIPQMAALASCSSLRTLSCTVDLGELTEGAAALAQLTQLTQLDLLVFYQRAAAPAAAVAEVWGRALGSLTGLKNLSGQPEVLLHVGATSLTALTHLVIQVGSSQLASNKRSIRKLLRRLAPARGRLQQVEVRGERNDAQQEVWRSQVTASLGDVALVFSLV